MFTVVAIPLTCWICALLAIPRRARFGNEIEELVYSRLLGRQHRIALLALLATAVAFVAFVIAIPPAMQPGRDTVSGASRVCADADSISAFRPICYDRGPGGTWVPDPMAPVSAWDPRLVIGTRIGDG